MSPMDTLPVFLDGAAISAETAAARLVEVVDQAAYDKARVILTRNGKRVAAIVPIEDYDALEAAEDAEDERLTAEAMAEWEAAGRPPGIPMEEILAEYGITLD